MNAEHIQSDEQAKPTTNDRFRIYALRVISGKEKKIKEMIENEVARQGWTDIVGRVIVHTEKVYKISRGKKVMTERNLLPGYILIEMDPERVTPEIIQHITSLPNVMHFLGQKNKPTPLTQSEANRMLGKFDEATMHDEAIAEPFIVGETIKIIDGPFKDFIGDVKEVMEDKKKLKVIVKIFGRGTVVELNYFQVEKIA